MTNVPVLVGGGTSAFNSTVQAASIALAVEMDEVPVVCELLQFDSYDRLVEDLEAVREVT